MREQEENRESEYRIIIDNLKPEINNFLWMRLPPETTLDRAEGIANQLFTIIHNEWEKPKEVKE